jgi:hypothetical protein
MYRYIRISKFVFIPNTILMKTKQIVFFALLLLIAGCDSMTSNSTSSSSSSAFDEEGPAIEDEGGIKNYIQGKWTGKVYMADVTYIYRFEIAGNQIKYWRKFGEWEWKSEPEEVLTYSLSSIQRDYQGKKYRTLNFEKVDLGISMGNGFKYEDSPRCLQFNDRCLREGWED